MCCYFVLVCFFAKAHGFMRADCSFIVGIHDQHHPVRTVYGKQLSAFFNRENVSCENRQGLLDETEV